MKVILSIAGSDSSAGAGIQQDLKTITSLGHYACTAITGLTAQNTMGVQSILPTLPEMLEAQISAVFDDIHVDAVKIGMIPDKASAEVIVRCLRMYNGPIVYDPVMISTSGKALMESDTMQYVVKQLFPLCTLITPNIPEYEHLISLSSENGKSNLSSYNILLKGGHAEGKQMVDTLIMCDGTKHTFATERIETKNLHGTGCTLSSAIATYLAEGQKIADAVKQAKDTISRAIRGGKNLHIGHGNGPLWCF